MDVNPLIYLDHAATTPTDRRVVEAMLPYFTEQYGNPSSTHRLGRSADRAVEAARETVAGILNCKPQEIVFTGCGTESDNLALRGPIPSGRPKHILTAHTEHHGISATAEQLAALMSVQVTWLPVTHEGFVTTAALERALSTTTADGPNDSGKPLTIVSIMAANNEIGTIQPIKELAAVAHAHGALFHTDAVQAGGQLPLDVQALGVDMLSLSAHKFYGPKGVGLLYVRQGIDLVPSQSGGGQESARRSGTQNVPLIVGMAKALELAYNDLEVHTAAFRRHRDRLIESILSTIPGVLLTGAAGSYRLPNHASFVFDGIESNALLMHLDMNGIAASSGSACNTGNPDPSDVLLAMGYEPALALGSLRLTVGRQTDERQIDRVLQVLPDAIRKIRSVRLSQATT